MTESNQSPDDQIPRIDAWLRSWTLGAARRPVPVLLVGLVLLALFWGLASRLKVQGDFVELLPTESQAAQRFRAALARKGGGESTLIVLIESPKPELNERLANSFEERLRKFPSSLVTHAEAGPRELTEFFKKWRWLYLDVKDLERIECVLSKEQARLSPAHLDIDDPCEEPAPAKGEAANPAKPAAGREQNSKLTQLKHEIEDRIREVDRFPDGFYRTPDRRVYSVVIRVPRAGMGEFSADELLDRVKALSTELTAPLNEPNLRIGFGGDIPNAVAEREALMNDIGVVSVVAVALVFASISIFFRSFVALLHVGFCTAIGTGFAFALASFSFGRLNAATSFLGSLIMGNGINYGIIYLARYRERRRAGDEISDALADAAVTCRRSTWLASLAAGGAYGSLLITSFRGFSEFGLIGGVGMLACWISTFITLPACVAWVEGRRPAKAVVASAEPGAVAVRVSAFIAACGTRWPRLLLAGAVLFTIVTSLQVSRYLRDPWEYNFSKLRSEASAKLGAGHWSGVANKVFAARGSPQLVLANDVSEVQTVAARILERDRQLTGGKFVEKVETIVDQLGGSPKIVAEKLELLEEIRLRIDALKHRLTGEDRQFADDWRPPEELRPLTAEDLPWALSQKFKERNGKVGTPVYVTLARGISQSRGENLLMISNILEGATGNDGRALPNASRAAVFSEMISSMRRDGPRATLLAFLIVVTVSVLVARSIRGIICVLGALLLGVLYMVGAAAWFDIRLNFLNFVALPLTFGIGVEYAINMFERIRYEKGDVASAARSVAGAIALCSLTAMLGYAALMFADNQALQSFGQYAILGEFSCFAAALLVMPAALLVWAGRRRAVLAVP